MNLERFKTYFPQIDALRFFAVLLVIISHWLPEHWINLFQIGRLGVDLFFVISGFLITRVLLMQRESGKSHGDNLKTFFLRRVYRIFPLYYVVVLITFLANRGIFEEALWWNLFYASNFFIIKLDAWPGAMSHFWTLSVEEHFYLLWPFIILLFAKKRLIHALIAIYLIGFCSRLYFHIGGYSYLCSYIFTSACFDTLALGGILANIFIHKPQFFDRYISRQCWLMLFPLLGYLCTIYYVNFLGHGGSMLQSVFFRSFSGLFFFFLIAHAIKSKAGIYHRRPFIFMGKLSYSIYLWHTFIPGFLLGITVPANIYLRLPMYFTVLILVSYLSWRWIEQPFNRLKKRHRYFSRNKEQ